MWKGNSVPDDVPQVLDSLDLPGIAKYMQGDACKHIFIMAGAGISTAAGIPDFRSPDTGLYANLARLKLPYPEAVFDINFFRRNPVPFYTLAHELAPGLYKPTITHAFIRLLADKGRLHTCFTQNIDTLERKAGVPPDKIVEAHGSFADQHCIDCGAPYSDEKMREAIAKKEIAKCEKKKCKGLVKPDIVFFGENLPPLFFSSVKQLRNADLLIVMGTSLTVHPFASLTEIVPNDCPRVLFNLDHVGGWGSRVNDVAALMRVDDATRELCKLLGWEDELMRLYREVRGEVDEVAETPSTPAGDLAGDAVQEATAPVGVTGAVEDIVDELSRAMENIALKQTETGQKETQGSPVVLVDINASPSRVDDSKTSSAPSKRDDALEGVPESSSNRSKKPLPSTQADNEVPYENSSSSFWGDPTPPERISQL